MIKFIIHVATESPTKPYKKAQIAKKYFKQIKDISKSDIFRLCEELFASGYMEECIIACNWSYSIHKQYEKSDFKIFQNWIENYVTNWAVCDTLCNHTV